MKEKDFKIAEEKVKKTVDEYILNKGYRYERGLSYATFLKQQYLISFDSLFSTPPPTQGVYNEGFAPVCAIYRRGRNLFAKACTLTSGYRQYYQKHYDKLNQFEKRRKELCSELTKAKFTRKLSIKIEMSNLNWLIGIVKEFPPPISVREEESVAALHELYNWFQTGEDYFESKKAADELFRNANLSPREVYYLKINSWLYKYMNHTSLVCLDELQQNGLALDEKVSLELTRIPKEYLAELFEYDYQGFRLRTGRKCDFGNGLFDINEQSKKTCEG